MIRLLLKLAGIFVLAYVVVHLGYTKLEKELVSRSCFDIVGLPTPVPANPTQGGEQKQFQPHTPESASVNKALPKDTTVNDSPQPPLENQSSVPANKEEEGALPTTPSTDIAITNKTVDYENPDFQIIIRRNIFQLTQQEVPTPVEEEVIAVVEKPPEEVQTALNLTLLGTVMGNDRTSRAIIIEEKKNEQKLYQVGDPVQGALIESIERGKVILDVFGAREILLLKKREGGGPGPSVISRRPRPPQPTRPDPVDIEDEDEEMEGIEDLEDMEDLEEDEEEKGDDTLEARVRNRRRPPSIRPHRRIGFRRNPIRNAPAVNSGVPVTSTDEETLLDQNDLPENE